MKAKTVLHATIILLLGSSTAMHAAMRTWSGGGADNFWANPANWGGIAPVAGDSLIFPGGAGVDVTSLNNTNDLVIGTTIGSITFSGTNYVLRGNVLLLTNGINHASGGTNTIGIGLGLEFNQSFVSSSGSGVLVLSNAVTLNGENLTFDATGTINVPAFVSGAGNITKTGDGTVRFGGANAYSGVTTINAGFLYVQNASALGSSAAGTVLAGTGGLVLNGVSVVGEALTNNSNFTFFQSADAAGWSGNIQLNGHLTIQVVAGTNDISGAIGGVGDLIKQATGTLRLSGSQPNTYSGIMHVEDGLLQLNKTVGEDAITGFLQIGDGSGALASAGVRLLAAHQINDSCEVIIRSDGTLDLNGNSDAIGTLNLSGNDVTTGAGTLTLGGNLSVNPTTRTATISGNLSLGNTTRTLSVPDGPVSTELAISAVISGSLGAGLNKLDGGTLQLSASNTYSGPTTVDSGFLEVANASALGSTANGTTLTGNGKLLLSGVAVAGEPLTNNTVSGLVTSSGLSGWSGNIVLNSFLNVSVPIFGQTNDLSGVISGIGGVNINGLGAVILSGTNANTYDGDTFVAGATLLLNKTAGIDAIPGDLVIGDGLGGPNADVVILRADSQINNSSAITIASSGLLSSGGFTDVVGPLSGSGNLQVTSGSIFTVNFNVGTVAFDGIISGSGTLNHNSAGTWILNGTNSFSGGSNLNGPTLVNGVYPANSILVNGTGTLGGTGTVGRVTVNANGTLSPGQSPGRLTTSNLSFVVSSKYRVELNGTNAGTSYDQLKVNGTVNNLASATLDAALGFNSAISNAFTIIDNDGSEAVTNTFLGLGEGATFNISGTPFLITYKGGSGNDVVLTQLAAIQRPILSIRSNSPTTIALSWPTNFTGFTLEANTNLSTNIWTDIATTPTVSGTNNSVSDVTSGPRKYYRLRGP